MPKQKQSTAKDNSIVPSADFSPKCMAVQNLQHLAIPAATVLAAFLGSFVATFWASHSSAAAVGTSTISGERFSMRINKLDEVNHTGQRYILGSQGEQPELSDLPEEEAENLTPSQARLKAEIKALKQQLASVSAAESQDRKTIQIAETTSIGLFTFMLLSAATFYVIEKFVLPKILGRLLKMGAEHFDKQILGVDVEVGNSTLDLFEGQIKIDELKIRNPECFQAEYLLTVNHVVIDLRMIKLIRSLAKTIEVEELTLDGITATYEPGSNGGPSNIQAIQDRLSGSNTNGDEKKDENKDETRDEKTDAKKEDPQPPPPPQQKGQRTTKLREVNILDTTIRFYGPIAKRVRGFDGAELKVDDIQFQNFDKEKKRGKVFSMEDTISFLLNTLLKSFMNGVTSFHALPSMIVGAASLGVETAEQGVHFVEEAVSEEAHQVANAAEEICKKTAEAVRRTSTQVEEMFGFVESPEKKKCMRVDPQGKCPTGAKQDVHYVEEKIHDTADAISENAGKAIHYVEEMLGFAETPEKKKCTRMDSGNCPKGVEQGVHYVEEKVHHTADAFSEEAGKTIHVMEEVLGFAETPDKKKCTRMDSGNCPQGVQQGAHYVEEKIHHAADVVSENAGKTIHYVEDMLGFVGTPEKKKCTRMDPGNCPKGVQQGVHYVEEIHHAADAVSQNAGKTIHYVEEMLGFVETPTKQTCTRAEPSGKDTWDLDTLVDPHLKCPRNHELLLIEAHGVTCDVCRDQIPDNTVTFKCLPCDYDLCNRCFRSTTWVSL